MTKIFLATIMMILLNSCGFSNMSLKNNTLSLEVEKNQFQQKSKTVKILKEHFGSLAVRKSILQLNNNKSLIVYEDSRTDLDYEFEYGISRTIAVIFGTKTIYSIFKKSNLHAYQIKLKNGKILNLIAQQDDTQNLKILYGMDKKLFSTILKKINPDRHYNLRGTLFTSQKIDEMILDRWNVQNVHFYPLVSPLPRFIGQ